VGHGMSKRDIVERIRGLRYVHVPVASELFDEACAEIERLRLTAQELEAVAFFADIHCDDEPPHEYADMLRSLLDRLRP